MLPAYRPHGPRFAPGTAAPVRLAAIRGHATNDTTSTAPLWHCWTVAVNSAAQTGRVRVLAKDLVLVADKPSEKGQQCSAYSPAHVHDGLGCGWMYQKGAPSAPSLETPVEEHQRCAAALPSREKRVGLTNGSVPGCTGCNGRPLSTVSDVLYTYVQGKVRYRHDRPLTLPLLIDFPLLSASLPPKSSECTDSFLLLGQAEQPQSLLARAYYRSVAVQGWKRGSRANAIRPSWPVPATEAHST